jgi:hypothetical protein
MIYLQFVQYEYEYLVLYCAVLYCTVLYSSLHSQYRIPRINTTAGYIIQRPGLEIVYVWYIKIFCTVCAILTCLTGTTQFPHFFE